MSRLLCAAAILGFVLLAFRGDAVAGAVIAEDDILQGTTSPDGAYGLALGRAGPRPKDDSAFAGGHFDARPPGHFLVDVRRQRVVARLHGADVLSPGWAEADPDVVWAPDSRHALVLWTGGGEG
jgi:hypothetical protein